MNKSNIKFRPLTEADLSLMTKWLNRPHLQRWWQKGSITLEAARRKYLPRMLMNDDARPFLTLINDQPIGFIQYYSAFAGDPKYWPIPPGPNVFGIDLFLADEDNLNKGLGTRMIRAFLDWLRNRIGIIEVWIDPHPDNTRAIRCYEKAGFRQKCHMDTPDGPAIWMILTQDNFT